MAKAEDPRARRMRGLYAIVDPDFCGDRGLVWVAERVLAGGCCALQLRAKRAAEDAIERWAHELLPICHRAGVPFILNDWPELARRVGADGVQLGQSDLALESARARLGAGFMIGISTHTLEQALRAEAGGADLIGFGPVFATRTKPDAEAVVGPDALRVVCRSVALPVVAIGGVSVDNVGDVVACGAQMAAAIGAVCGADDPADAAHRFQRAFGLA